MVENEVKTRVSCSRSDRDDRIATAQNLGPISPLTRIGREQKTPEDASSQNGEIYGYISRNDAKYHHRRKYSIFDIFEGDQMDRKEMGFRTKST